MRADGNLNPTTQRDTNRRQMPDAADELAPHGFGESFEAAARSTRDR